MVAFTSEYPKFELGPPYPYSCNGSLLQGFKLESQLRAPTQSVDIS